MSEFGLIEKGLDLLKQVTAVKGISMFLVGLLTGGYAMHRVKEKRHREQIDEYKEVIAEKDEQIEKLLSDQSKELERLRELLYKRQGSL